MGKWRMRSLILVLGIALSAQTVTVAEAAADKTTKYRVYQYDQPLMEFADYNKAIQYAQGYSSTRVEDITTGKWRWNNYPRYAVYQLGKPVENGQFTKLEDAIREASKLSYASIRDVEGTGWVWNNYPRYQVYQGEITLDSWFFGTLNSAIAEAKKWGGSHIIDLENNQWVWDNLSASDKAAARSSEPAYQVYQGTYTQDSWKFPYLEDAVSESLNWGNSVVVRISDQKTVYSNWKRHQVYQNDNQIEAFISLSQAIAYAEQYAHSAIRLDNSIIWNNDAPYRVYQGTHLIGDYTSFKDALDYAAGYSNASIKRWDGNSLWNNIRKLKVWAWNGSASKETLAAQTQSVMGLDVDSPTWFILDNASGKLKDSSSKEAVDLLRSRGLEIHPLVGNQFDSALTSQFLANTGAQSSFIQALVNKASSLGVDGLNIDFESLSGKDRNAFTAFIKSLTDAAHEKNLKISVDLPRGSTKWNHLSAFDHEKLGGIADYIITMAYDQHYSGSDKPGSVAGLQWVEEGIQEFLSYGIPRDKLVLGIPFYVREWSLDAKGTLLGNKALYTRDLTELMAKRNAVKTWDPAFLQYKVQYTGDDGNNRIFWLEDNASVQARLELAKKYQLSGVAAWRLGQEDPGFWGTVLQNK